MFPNIELQDGCDHLGGEVTAKLELLERHGHGVGAEEEDEGHEGQVRDVLAGLSHQRAAVLQTLLLAQLTPVQSCHIQLVGVEWGQWGGQQRTDTSELKQTTTRWRH